MAHRPWPRQVPNLPQPEIPSTLPAQETSQDQDAEEKEEPKTLPPPIQKTTVHRYNRTLKLKFKYKSRIANMGTKCPYHLVPLSSVLSPKHDRLVILDAGWDFNSREE